jgi:hypothetical protein
MRLVNGVLAPSYAELVEEKRVHYGVFASQCHKNKHIRKIILPEGVTHIKSERIGIFSECEHLMEVVFPRSLRSIGENAFVGCRALERAHLPEGLRTVGTCAFSQCESLAEIRIPTTATSICAVAFFGCKGVQTVVLPENSKQCHPSTFYGCSNLKTLVVYTSKESSNALSKRRWWLELTARLHLLERVSAPDHVVAELGGIFEPYKTFAELPRALRVSPSGLPFARDMLHLWYTPTWPNNRVPSPHRRRVVKTLLTLCIRTRNANIELSHATGTPLPPFVDMYMWFYILGFVRHTDMMH